MESLNIFIDQFDAFSYMVLGVNTLLLIFAPQIVNLLYHNHQNSKDTSGVKRKINNLWRKN